MSMRHMVKAFDLKLNNPLRKLILIKLADNANEDGICWPSYQHIADKCDCSRRSVITHIKELQKDGLIQIESRYKDNKSQSNIFRLSLFDEDKVIFSSAGDSLPSAGDSLPSGEGAAPRNNHSFEPSNESPPPTAKPKKLQLKTYLQNCEDLGIDPIPSDSIVFKNADALSLPYEFVLVAWDHFKSHWLSKTAPKADWELTFNNCLKNDGYGAYRRNSNGEWFLTTKGKNTQILLNTGEAA